jgi:hypothetical protein
VFQHCQYHLHRIWSLPHSFSAGQLRRGRANFADAEVEHLDEVRLLGGRQQIDIGGLEVAVNDFLGVCGGQGRCHLLDDAKGAGGRQATVTAESLVEILAFQKLRSVRRA